jgi:hypothetical protein
MVPEDNPDIAVSSSRVNRVRSRRIRPPRPPHTSARLALTFYIIVHSHVQVTLRRRIPAQDAFAWTSRP